MTLLKDLSSSFQESNNIFVSPREAGEKDLIAEVRSILHVSGLAMECAAAFDTNQYIIDGALIGPKGQQFLLNRFWNLQLLTLGVVSIEERFCLIESGSFEDWIRLFKSKIVPCLVNHRLPKVI